MIFKQKSRLNDLNLRPPVSGDLGAGVPVIPKIHGVSNSSRMAVVK